MLHLGMNVLFVIWSTTIGKIVSGHSLDCAFSSLLFFLSLQVLLFLLSFLFFASLHFSFSSLCFTFSCERTILFCFFDTAYHRGRYMCTIEIIDREFVGCNCRITERKMGFFAFCMYIRNLFQIEVSGASVHPSEIHQVNVCSARVCVREQLVCTLYALRVLNYHSNECEQ